MKPRDIISSVVFYVGLIGVTLVLLRIGSQYGCESVPTAFTRMEPKLGRGDNIVVNKWARRPDELDYENIIMFKRAPWKRVAWDYEFGRVIGKPGDQVALKHDPKDGKLKLYRAERREGKLDPEQPVTEHYLNPRDRPAPFSAFIVPRNTIFVLFDSRSGREPLRDFLVPIRSIVGRVLQ
jgi:signal peptidase I